MEELRRSHNHIRETPQSVITVRRRLDDGRNENNEITVTGNENEKQAKLRTAAPDRVNIWPRASVGFHLFLYPKSDVAGNCELHADSVKLPDF